MQQIQLENIELFNSIANKYYFSQVIRLIGGIIFVV